MITSTGYSNKTLATIMQEQRTEFETVIDPYVNLLPEEVLGQLRDIFAKGLKDAYDLGQAVYGQMGLTATGIGLDIVAKLIGKTRKPATKANIRNYTVVASSDITLPANTQFRGVNDPNNLFETVIDIDLTTGSNSIDIVAVSAGSISVTTDDISVIATPVIGLTSGTNSSGSTFINGTEIETDDEFRLRLFQVPAIARTLRVDAIENAILDLNDDADNEGYTEISAVKIIENEENVTNLLGMLPHTIQAVVYYPGTADAVTDSKVAEAIAQSKPDGIKTVSTTTSSYSESVVVGNSTRNIIFSRPDTQNIYIDIDTSPTLSGADKTALKADIVAWGATLTMGSNVIVYGKNSLSDVINNFANVEITDYTIDIGTSGSPSGDDNITIGDTEIALIAGGNINIGDL
jgi:hypothetical protein